MTNRGRMILIGVAAIFLLLMVFGLVRACSGDTTRKEAAQADQTVKSGDAIANAAQDAVGTVMNRTEAERAIDAATTELKEEIGNAQNPADLRTAVARNVCVRAEYRNDPACAVR